MLIPQIWDLNSNTPAFFGKGTLFSNSPLFPERKEKNVISIQITEFPQKTFT